MSVAIFMTERMLFFLEYPYRINYIFFHKLTHKNSSQCTRTDFWAAARLLHFGIVSDICTWGTKTCTETYVGSVLKNVNL